MALTRERVTDKIEILEDGTMQIREATYIVEDGVRIMGPAYHRRVLLPTDQTTNETGRVKAVAEVVVSAEDRDKPREVIPEGGGRRA